MDENDKGLEYILKALEIRKSLFGDIHPDVEASYRTLEIVYNKLGQKEKAAEYHLKAEEILKSENRGLIPESEDMCLQEFNDNKELMEKNKTAVL